MQWVTLLGFSSFREMWFIDCSCFQVCVYVCGQTVLWGDLTSCCCVNCGHWMQGSPNSYTHFLQCSQILYELFSAGIDLLKNVRIKSGKPWSHYLPSWEGPRYKATPHNTWCLSTGSLQCQSECSLCHSSSRHHTSPPLGHIHSFHPLM